MHISQQISINHTDWGGDGFFKGFMGIHEGKKKVLVTSYNSYLTTIWRANSHDKRYGCSSIYIYLVLGGR